MSKLDFRLVNDRALQSIDSVLGRWLPGGKRQGNEYVVTNPRRSDSHPGSFSINTTNGIWSDFATGDKGGDLIALIAYIDSAGMGDACRSLASFLSIDPEINGKPSNQAASQRQPSTKPKPVHPDFEPIRPVPEAALKACPTSVRNLGKPSMYWDYLGEDGKQILLRVMRFDEPNSTGRTKDYRPWCYGKDKKGQTAWCSKMPTTNRPLYGLNRLATAPADAPILLCEGEKAAQAGKELFPGAVAMTWPSGSKSIGKADFTPLAGRTVWYFRDNDQAGQDSIEPMKKALNKAEVLSVAVLNIELFAQYLPGKTKGKPSLLNAKNANHWPEKSDPADAVLLGWTADHIVLLMEKGLIHAPEQQTPPAPSNDKNNETQPHSYGSQFRSSDNGLYYFDPTSDQVVEIGARLDVLAQTRDERRRNWGLLVSFPNKDGEIVEWNIPLETLSTETGVEVIKGLLMRGYRLKTTRAARKRIIEYLGDHPTAERMTIVNQMGWQKDGTFMLPAQIIGEPDEALRYYSDEPTELAVSTAGSLDDWQENIAKHCIGNSRMSLAVCTAFAAPMLHLLGENESLGVHILGPSRSGKSTALEVAASVYGQSKSYKQTWKNTDNAVESMASIFNDYLLVLDEIAEMDNRKLGDVVYMLGNGKGKGRAGITGRSVGGRQHWKLTFLSSGEESLEQLLRQAGQKVKAGHEIRLLSVPSVTHKSKENAGLLGGYETSGQFSGGSALSDHLKRATNKFYGTPIITLLNRLIETNHQELSTYFNTARENFAFLYLPNGGKGGQAESAVKKFSILAGAGEFATKHGITGWPEGWATQAVGRCFHAWIRQRGGTSNLEDKQAIDHIREILMKHCESHFSRLEGDVPKVDEHAPRTMERWGFRKTITETYSGDEGSSETILYIPAKSFEFICKGFNKSHVADLLDMKGALVEKDPPEKNGTERKTKNKRLPGSGKKTVKCYVIGMAQLMEDDEPDPIPETELNDIPGFD